MATQPRSPELLRKTWDAYEAHNGNASVTARFLDKPPETVRSILKECRAKGMHLSEGAQKAVNNAGLSGAEARGGWIHNYDDEGKKTGTTRWNAPEIDVETYIDRIRSAFDDIPPAIPTPQPEHIMADSLALLPHADCHWGMVVTADQVGGRPYNREIASERFKIGVSRCVMNGPPCHTAYILNAGDLTHANDDNDVTPRSKHKLKVEGTHMQNFELSVTLTAYKIDLALQRHGRVIYRAIPGNHDPNTPGPLSIALRERYRNEPRVEVIVSEDEFWQMNWGNVFLSGHHGHARNPKDVCPELPGRFPTQWGEAKAWHFFTAHKHNYQTMKYGPVRHHQLPSVCSADTHAAWSPYDDDAGMLAMTFHKSGRTTSNLLVGV